MDSTVGSGVTATRVPTAVKLSYGVGHIVYGVSNTVIATFLFFYYTAVMGLSGSLVGAAAAISLIIDAFIDPLLGSWSDNVRSRWGRRVPFLIIGAPLVAIALVLLFSPPPGASQTVLFAWLLSCSVFLRFSMSAFTVPFTALGAELSEDYVERSSIVAYRWVFEVLGGLAVIILGYSVFFAGPHGMLVASAYRKLTLAGAAMAIIAGGLCVLGVRRFAGALTVGQADAAGLYRRLAREVAEVFRNRAFVILFVAMVLFFAAQGVAGSLSQHMNRFVWGMSPAQIQTVAFGLFIGLIVGVPIAPQVVKRLEKRTIFMLGLIALSLAQGVPGGLRALGVFTLHGSAVVAPLFANSFFAGIGVTLASVAAGSMMADAADEHDYLFNARREGLYFAGIGFAAKTAYGVGAFIAGRSLDLIGFPVAKIGAQGVVSIGPPVLRALSVIAGPLAAVLGIAGLLLMLFYGVDRARHALVMDALRLRRSQAL